MPELDSGQFDVVLTLGDIGEATLDYISHRSGGIPQYGVPGGHDSILPIGVSDLHCKIVTLKGIRIGGFGGAPKYKDRPFHYSGRQVVKEMRKMPSVDVLITHTPPLATSMDEDPVHRGFQAFDRYIKHFAPSYLIHGHLERYYKSKIGRTTVYGITWRRPLTLSFDKANYPPDNLEPRKPSRFSAFLKL
jgi:Icc-related predicted phosphoesterase